MVWSYTPQNVLPTTLEADTHLTAVNLGVAVAGQHTTTIVRRFGLEYALVEQTQAGSMLAFVDSHQGALRAFDWTHPGDSVTYRVRFDDPVTAELFQPGFVRFGRITLVTVVGS